MFTSLKEPNRAMDTTIPPSTSLRSIFDMKYIEFVEDLRSAIPELNSQLKSSLKLSTGEKNRRFAEEVLPYCSPTRDLSKCPGKVLPEVTIPDVLWRDIGTESQKAIQDHLSLLSFCCLYDSKYNKPDISGNSTSPWMDEFTNSWKTNMEGIDFQGMSKKLTEILQ